jgi:predicted house-cleaning noncanonical NTP pyrophosphatase (MazG superfamily)
MLTEVKNNYKSILKHFDFDESISSAAYKKQKLIEMAKSGNSRPSQKTNLGRFLSDYTCKTRSYCKKFDKLIRELAPDWFVSRTQIANKNKQNLIKMAKSGEDRPKARTKIGRQLCEYTNKSSNSYCPIFDKIINRLAPNWFLGKEQISYQKKQRLIKLAKSGSKRPNKKTKEGQLLINYTCKKSGSYCRNFDKNIRKLRPDWFISRTQIANKKKQDLIKMANRGKDRPIQKTEYGSALTNYTCKFSGCYCPTFDKTIRKLRPDWFGTTHWFRQRKCSPK